MDAYNTTLDAQFAEDVRHGLTTSPKYVPHKYFFDAEGSRIFQQIMATEDYYLTKCEYEILAAQKSSILNALPAHFDVVELGSGDGLKTKILLKHFAGKGLDCSYLPIDISLDILKVLEDSLAVELPQLSVHILHDDYFVGLEKAANLTQRPKFVLFLGSNIGNYTVAEAEGFLTHVRRLLNKGDFFYSGFDLVKNPKTMVRAYSGFADFNFNLLKRINAELHANFDLSSFTHHSSYNPQTGDRSCFLVSKKAQKVWIDALQLEVNFEEWETIHTLLSQKYTISEVIHLAKSTGFIIKNNYFDGKEYFMDSLWEAV